MKKDESESKNDDKIHEDSQNENKNNIEESE
jgi:hypothetical protein